MDTRTHHGVSGMAKKKSSFSGGARRPIPPVSGNEAVQVRDPQTAETVPSRPGGRSRSTRREPFAMSEWVEKWGWVFWLLACFTVFAVYRESISSNYLPKSLWASLSLGLGFLFILPLRSDRPGIELTRLGGLWLAYLAWIVLSFTWSAQPRVGFERLLALLLPTCAYLFARRVRFWESRVFWDICCGIICCVALLGILQYAVPEKHLPGLYKWLKETFPGTANPRSSLGHRNYASIYLLTVIPYVGWRYFKSRSWRDALLPLATLLLVCLFVLLARTRSAWAGAVVAGVFFLVAGGYRKLLAHRIRLIPFGVVLLIGLCLLPIVKPSSRDVEQISNKTENFETIMDPGNRLSLWRVTLGITNPILGCGFGNFPIVLTPYSLDARVKTLNWEVHNDYLQAYLDLGVPGALLFLAATLYAIWLGWRGRRNALLLAAGMSMVGIAVAQGVEFMSEKVSTLLWIGATVAILNSQGGGKPLARWLAPRGAVVLGRLAIGLYLIGFSIMVGYTLRGDHVFWVTEAVANGLRNVKKEYVAVQNKPLAERRKETQTYETNRRIFEKELNNLMEKTVPAMQFDPNTRHVLFHKYMLLSNEFGLADPMRFFASQALALHPTDQVARLMLVSWEATHQNLDRATQLLEEGVKVFRYNPHSDLTKNLIKIYEHQNKADLAEAVQTESRQRWVVMPTQLYPAESATDVPVNPTLTWTASEVACTYDLYLWEMGDDTPEDPFLKDLSENKAQLDLKPGTTYFWKVRASGYKTDEQVSDMQAFRTVDQ